MVAAIGVPRPAFVPARGEGALEAAGIVGPWEEVLVAVRQRFWRCWQISGWRAAVVHGRMRLSLVEGVAMLGVGVLVAGTVVVAAGCIALNLITQEWHRWLYFGWLAACRHLRGWPRNN